MAFKSKLEKWNIVSNGSLSFVQIEHIKNVAHDSFEERMGKKQNNSNL